MIYIMIYDMIYYTIYIQGSEIKEESGSSMTNISTVTELIDPTGDRGLR